MTSREIDENLVTEIAMDEANRIADGQGIAVRQLVRRVITAYLTKARAPGTFSAHRQGSAIHDPTIGQRQASTPVTARPMTAIPRPPKK